MICDDCGHLHHREDCTAHDCVCVLCHCMDCAERL